MKKILTKSLALLCACAASASAQVVIKDFQGFGPTHSFDFDYLSWTDQITNTATGIEVGDFADTFGGAGGSTATTLDLTGNTYLVVSAKLLPGNSATAFNVILQSAPGVSSVYQFSTAGLTINYQPVSASLASPLTTTGGGANLAAITGYEFQGNFEGPVALGLGFASVTAVSDPIQSTILEDFQGAFAGYTYGSWFEQTTPGPDFFTVGGTATEEGGLGNGYPTTDFSSYETNGQVTLEVRLLAGNAADSFNVLLQSGDNFNNRYNFSTNGLNTTDFVTVSMALADASGIGSEGALDWAAFNTYQVQGDFGSTDAFQMEFRNLAIDAAPFDVPNSTIRTNSNLISGSGGVNKTGTGTLILTGANTYTGDTTVNLGTLALVGGSQTSDITVATGASLGFTLGSPPTSTAAVTLTDGTVAITGAVDNVSSYKLMTAASFTGPFTLAPAIPGYRLQTQAGNTELWLVPGDDPFLIWAGPGVNFEDDANNDGVDNGLAWLLGAADKDVNATDKLPVTTQTGGDLKLTFDMLPAAGRDGAALYLEHSSNLGTWTSGVLVPDATGGTAPVTFFVTDSDLIDPENPLDVEATVSSSAAAAGKLFGRLRAER